MIKGNFWNKCISFMMVIALLVSVASPASAAVASTFKDSAYQAHYVALGDAATEGVGLDNPETDSYIVKIAEKNGWGDDYWAYAKKSLRVEELRYLLDSEYTGDGYTAAMGSFLRRDRATVQGYVSNAEVITINAGVNNFSTYIVEQMVYYLENNGATKYSYSFDEFAGADVAEAMENVKAAVMDNFYAAADQNGDEALDLINYVAEVSTYAVLSYVTSFNGMVSSIYELNSDVDLYVIGIYNPAQGEKLTYEIGGRTINVPIGDFFGALVEIANAYSQILAPRAYDYTYVDPGNPELLIDQMGNTNLTDDERIPNGLMIELLALTEGAAVNEVVDLFADYGITKTENEALMFLEDLLSCNSDEERTQFIMDTLNEYVVDAVYDEFVNQLASYLGQFGNGEDVLSEQEIKDLLADLDAAADEAARELVAGAFVDDLLTTPELLNQAAAQVIYEYIESYGLSGYVTVDNVVTLLEDMADCAENEREGIVTAWVHKLAVAKITAYVQNIVGEDYTEAMADQMLTDMKVPGVDPTAVAKEALWNDVFAEYLSEKIEDKFGEQGLQLINYGSFDAFVAAIYAAGDNYDVVVRETIRASGAAKVSDAAYGVYSTDEIIALFAGMDAKATDAEKKAYLNQQLGHLATFLSDSFWAAYNAYVSATNTTINLIGQYLDGVDTAAEALAEYIAIQNDIVIQILEVYAENFDSNSGSLDLSGFADFQQLRGDAVSKILSGYDDYRDAVDSAMKSADTFGEYMDPVYELLLSLAEVDTISLNDLLSVAQKITTNGQSYVVDMVDNLMVGKDLGEDEKTAAYLALRYYLAGAMMIMPSANGHATIANRVTAAINGENMNSTVGNLANMVINGGLDLYHCAKEFLALPTTGSGQAGTLINPDVYVALGDDITLGTAIDGADTYVKLLADALAMEYHDTANYDNDMILNHAIGGIRTEELLALLDPNYNGDAYTDARYGEDYIEAKREQIIANIMAADLITIEVGINNLVTYPLTQALLAYNGEDTYEMDWTRYFAQSRVDKVSKGKDAVTKLILGIVDKAENRVPSLEGVSAYDKCETALNTISTAVEALAYGVLGYIVNLDAAVETVAEMNDDATIVLVGFYNPLEDTYVKLQRSISVGGKDIELPQREINVSAIADKLINVSNRFLTNYVGNIAGDGTASDEGSRIVTVDIKDAELCISDTGASKNLAIMESWRTVSVKGYDIDILVPEYFLETGRTAGEALHPNAAGHEYIFQQILAALKYEIHADVNPEYNWKYYGEDDPELYYSIDDESSLYDMIVELEREPGEDVGFYDITATAVHNGYYEVDVYVGTFEIKARPIAVDVTVVDGVIINVELAEGSNDMAFEESFDVLNLELNAEGTAVVYNNDNYIVTINADFQTTVVPDYVCWNTTTGKHYEIVHLAVLEANEGETIEMLKDSDQTAKTDVYHYAGSVNLINGVTLDLKGFELTLDSLFAAEDNYVIANYEKSAGEGGRLTIPKSNLVINDTAKDGVYTVLPFWMEDEGCYVFGIFGLTDTATAQQGLVIDVENDRIYYRFDHKATSYLNSNFMADNGTSDNGLSFEVYLQWQTPTGVSYQHYVFTDDVIAAATGKSDYYYTLTNFSQLSIDVNTLTITARIVADCGATLEFVTYGINGPVTPEVEIPSATVDHVFNSATGYVCMNTTTGMYYEIVHDAVLEAQPGDTIQMIANSDQTALKDICPSAGMVNLTGGVTLDLQSYVLKLDVLIAPAGNYVIGNYEKSAGEGGRLIVPKSNLVLDEAAKDGAYTVLPFWMEDEGCYVFGVFGLTDTATAQQGLVIDVENDRIYYRFDHKATSYLNSNFMADNGTSDNGLSFEVYLQWQTPTGVSYQHYVFTDDVIAAATGRSDYYYTLTNFSQLSIDVNTLVVTVRIVSDSGSACEGT